MFGGILNVLRELDVEKVIIGKQGEECELYKEFCNIVKEKNIPVVVIGIGDIINVEKNLKIRVLFPENELIEDNILNNNSLVFKIEFKKFRILFTGDIEQIAEERLLKLYDVGELIADILKVPHHGSKSSSIEKFVEAVSPQVALIGVGENNKFGHPNGNVIKRLISSRM